MNSTDQKLSDEAFEWVKRNHQEITKIIAGNFNETHREPVSIFMAGSPGAGKTEFSKHLVEQISDYKRNIVRIDPDEIRELIPSYIPGKSEVLNTTVNKAIEKIHDHVLHFNKNFLLDGTLASLDVARKNIERSLTRNRVVKIQYVYQDPKIAWDFTQKRETIEGRNIPKEAFIREFFAARENVNILKEEFGNRIIVDMIQRDVQRGEYTFKFNINNIDKHIKDNYNTSTLMETL